MRAYSHSYWLVIFVQPKAAEYWRGSGGKLSNILGKKQYLINTLYLFVHRKTGIVFCLCKFAHLCLFNVLVSFVKKSSNVFSQLGWEFCTVIGIYVQQLHSQADITNNVIV